MGAWPARTTRAGQDEALGYCFEKNLARNDGLGAGTAPKQRVHHFDEFFRIDRLLEIEIGERLGGLKRLTHISRNHNDGEAGVRLGALLLGAAEAVDAAAVGHD